MSQCGCADCRADRGDTSFSDFMTLAGAFMDRYTERKPKETTDD